MKYVLSLDGGGVRGIVQAYMLSKIQKELNKPLWGKFDLIVGTSTGGLEALLIGAGFTGEQILEFYINESQNIFDKNTFSFDGVTKQRFSSKKFQKIANKVFGDLRLKDLKTKVVVPTYCLELGKHVIHRSYDSESNTALCSDLAVAISSAPTYFNPKNIQKISHIDGGIFMNNPATEAAITGIDLYGNDFKLLALGNGNPLLSISGEQATNASILFWFPIVLEIIFDAVSAFYDDQCRRLLKNRFLRINSVIPANIESRLDCCSSANIQKLIAFADEIWIMNKQHIIKEFLA